MTGRIVRDRQPAASDGTVARLRLAAQAAIGVASGVLFALAIAALALPSDGPPRTTPDGLLPCVLGIAYLKPRERAFYVLALVLGGAGGYFATWRIAKDSVRFIGNAALLVVLVPLLNEVIGRVMAGAGPVVPVLLGLALIAWLSWIMARGGPAAAGPETWAGTNWPRSRLGYLFLLVLLSLVLIPYSFTAVALKIGFNVHPVSFFIGPALYFFGNGLLPGLDYYTQYSIGLPWLLHFVIGHSPQRVVLIYAYLVILATWLFYAHLIYLLGWLYRSWVAAALVAFVPLFLGFCYPEVIPAYYFAPSSSILRYPLLTVCALLMGRWAEAPSRPARVLAMAAATAAAIFLETESGIVMALSAVVTLCLVHPWRLMVLPAIAAFLAAVGVLCLVGLLGMLGAGALQFEFLRRFFEAFFFYSGSGIGSRPISWTMERWNWFYHLVAPGLSLATLAAVARLCANEGVDKKRLAVLGFLASSGLMLLFKFVNESSAALWQMSAIGPLSVVGWWCLVLLRRVRPARSVGTQYQSADLPLRTVGRSARLLGYRAAAAAMIVLPLVFVYSPSESMRPVRPDEHVSPARYGIRAWLGYPSLMLWPFRPAQAATCIRRDCLPEGPSRSDVALIQARTRPGEQVAIINDTYDWTYLLAAHRPPLMFFLPGAYIFATRHLQESVERLRRQTYLFTPKGMPLDSPAAWSCPDVRAAIAPLLGSMFKKDGDSDQLTAWRRTSP